MKKVNKYIALGLGALTLASCESLDTRYQGYYVTTEQKEEVLEFNPEMAVAAVTGCTAQFSLYGSVYDAHFDFGYPAIMIGTDLQGNDFVCDWTGYNWFTYWEGFTSPTAGGTPSGMAWYHIYDQIYACNQVTATISEDTTEDQLKFFLAQAKAIRAFDYFNLAQLYQFNYAAVDPNSAKGVPIVTESTDASNGVPRSTLQELYDFIMSDLNSAIDLLSNTSTTAAQVIDSKPKRLVSLATAYGLRARVNLVMHNYAAAAQDAQNAISKFSGSPYTIADVSKPGFTSIDDSSWMWGIAIAETDRVVTTGICNFPSMVCSFSNGYVNYGAWKYCDKNLYDAIPANDARKGWFLDASLQSTSLNAQQQAYLDSYASILPYTNVKFNSYQGVMSQTTNASDIPLMRIEEMYYILAEGQVMSGNIAGGLDTYYNFVSTYRNPRLVKPTANSAEEAQNIIYQDRRVEFWGEGLSFFDVMRLSLPINRVGSNWPTTATFQIPNNPTDGACLIYCIPQGEINGNPAISASDNNPETSRPVPIQ